MRLLFLLPIVLVLSACYVSEEDLAALRETQVVLADKMDVARDSIVLIRQEIAINEEIPEEDKEEMTAEIAKWQETLAETRIVFDEISALLDPETRGEATQALVSTASGFLPPPWNIIASVVGSLVLSGGAVGVMERKKLKRVIAGVQAGGGPANPDDAIAKMSNATRALVNKIQETL